MAFQQTAYTPDIYTSPQGRGIQEGDGFIDWVKGVNKKLKKPRILGHINDFADKYLPDALNNIPIVGTARNIVKAGAKAGYGKKRAAPAGGKKRTRKAPAGGARKKKSHLKK